MQAIDMTGWIMAEHGIPESKLRVIEKYGVSKDGHATWLCECSCKEHNRIIVEGKRLRNGNTKSCGCLKIDKLIERSKKENKYDLSGECGILWPTNSNEKIYFDLEDANKILNHTWYINPYGYPETHINEETITMHKLLGYYRPDHNNRNKLDNRKENLIPCTIQENNRNRSIRSNNTSGIIGVYWNKKNNKWVAYINPGYKMKYLGSFCSKEDAIKCRLLAEAKYFGEFAPQRHLFKEYGIESEDVL